MRLGVHCIWFLFLTLSGVVSTLAQTPVPVNPKTKEDDRLHVLDDSGTIGALGTFHGPGDTIELETVSPLAGAPEGTKVLQGHFGVGPRGWAGLVLKPGMIEQDSAIDTSRYAKNGELCLWIRSSHDVQIGIRSRNIAAGQERSKLWLRREKLAELNGRWERVCIELKRFAELEDRLRFNEMQVMLMIAVVNPESERFAFVRIDDVAWFLSRDSREPPRRSALLPIDLGAKDFVANDLQGRSCTLSNDDGELELSHSRPSSGHNSTVLDLKKGIVSFTWSHPGLGHGNQIVLPFGDARYPGRLERLANRLRYWAGVKVVTYYPSKKTTPLPAETQTKLETAATRLLALREAYPVVNHDPKQDAVWEGEGASAVLRLRATASKALTLEVVGRTFNSASADALMADREADDKEFSALFPFPPRVYEEAVGQAHLRQLRRFKMTPNEGGFDVRIPIWCGRNRFHYAIVAHGENNRAAVCLPDNHKVFVAPE